MPTVRFAPALPWIVLMAAALLPLGPPRAAAAPPDAERARISQVLDGLSEAELRELLLKVQAQEAEAKARAQGAAAAAAVTGRGASAPDDRGAFSPPAPPRAPVPPVSPAAVVAPAPRVVPATPAVPVSSWKPRTAKERLEWMRQKVLVDDASEGVLATLGPMAQKPEVRQVTEDLIGQFLRRQGAFSHFPQRPRASGQKPTEVRFLAEKLRVAIAQAMGPDAPYGLSPSARTLFEERILTVLGTHEEGPDLSQERERLEAKLKPPPPPPRPLSAAEIAAIDAIFQQQATAERKVTNHSPQYMKRWVEEEARRRRRKLVASGGARDFLRRHR